MALTPGITVEIGGRSFTVPCFSYYDGRRLDESGVMALAFDVKNTNLKDRYLAVLDVIHSALARNYPELGREELEKLLDKNNSAAVLRAIMEANDMISKEPASGEQGPRPVAQGDGAALHGPETVAEPA